MQPVVDLAGVRVRRGQRWLLDGIDLQVGTRDRWVVIGPNGAGKTTRCAAITSEGVRAQRTSMGKPWAACKTACVTERKLPMP